METIFSSLPQFLAVCAALALAEAIYVLLGFGAGLIAVGTLALVVPNLQDVVVLLLLVNLPAELYVVLASRRHVSWRGVLLVFVGIAAGIPIGTWLLSVADLSALLTILGLLLVVVGSAFLLTPDRGPQRMPAWTTPPVGLLSGLLTGLFGTGGPPLIFYYQLRGIDKAAFRGTLMAIFLLMTAIRVPSYAAFGLITMPRLWSSAAVFPAVLAGAWIGNRIHLRVDETSFRRMVSIALIVIGLVLLARSL